MIQQLQEIVGTHNLLQGEDCLDFETDWTGRFRGKVNCVVRPENTEQVALILKLCTEKGCKVITQGGNTGLVGGGVPRGVMSNSIILSLQKLKGFYDYSPLSHQVSLGAGNSLEDLQDYAHKQGLIAGLDFGARNAASIGGIAATNAGGIQAVGYGVARDHITALEIVLADGRILPLGKDLLKDNAGYQLYPLFIGSEGTLGIITKVRWQLQTRVSNQTLFMIGLHSLDQIESQISNLKMMASNLVSIDYFTDRSLRLVCDYKKQTAPLESSHYLLVQAEGENSLEQLAQWCEQEDLQDVVVADDSTSIKNLWSFREAIPEVISTHGTPIKLDIGVPLKNLSQFLEKTQEILKVDPQIEAHIFGHLGDGNLHVNLLNVEKDYVLTLEEQILQLACSLGGTISAEHGVGVAKAEYLRFSRSISELQTMRQLKHTLDSQNLLNPGVVLK